MHESTTDSIASPAASLDAQNQKDVDAIHAGWPTDGTFHAIRKVVYGAKALPEIDPFSFATDTDVSEIVAAFLTRIDGPVLDLGCGNGQISRYVGQRLGAKIVGVDYSAAAIESARSLPADGNTFVMADFRDLPFADGEYRNGFSIDALMAGYRPNWNEIARVIAPGGRFAFTSWFPTAVFGERQAIVMAAMMNAGFEVSSIMDTDPGLERQRIFYRYVIQEHAAIRRDHGERLLQMLLAEAKNLFSGKTVGARALVVLDRV